MTSSESPALGLIAFDLDGTVLPRDPERRMSERVANALAAAAEKGYEVALATGRPKAETPAELWNLPWLAWRICSSGTVVYRGGSDGPVYEEFLEPAALKEALAIVGEGPLRAWADVSGGYLMKALSGGLDDHGWLPPCGTEVQDLVVACAEAGGIHKLMIHYEDSGVREAAQSKLVGVIGDRAVVANEGAYSIEVTPAGSGKGPAAVRVCEVEGIDPRSSYAFGDSGNDLSFADSPLTFVAMADAEQKVLAAADAVCPTVDEDGVAVWIEEHLL